jgi:hypothetical protein
MTFCLTLAFLAVVALGTLPSPSHLLRLKR